MTSQAPQLIRTVFALVAGLPEEKIRIVSPDLGGGFGNKVPVYPGYVVATAASLLLGHPVKWIEERSENLISTGFARDFWMHGEMALKAGRDDDRPPGLARRRRGRVPRRRPAVEVQGRAVPHRERVLRPAHGARHGRRLLHEQGPGRRRLPMLVPRDRGLVHDRAARAERRLRDRHGSGRASARRTSSRRTSSRTSRATGFRVRLGRLPRRRWTSRSRRWGTSSCARSRPRRASRAA